MRISDRTTARVTDAPISRGPPRVLRPMLQHTSTTVMPTTSQPTPDRFEQAYAEMCDRFEYVYSIHIAAELSGTVGVAREVAERYPRVRVLDSGESRPATELQHSPS